MIGEILNFISAPQVVLFCIVLSVASIVFFLLRKRDKAGVKYGSSYDLAGAKLRARNMTLGLLCAVIVTIVSMGFVLANSSSDSVSAGDCKNKDPNRRDTMIVVDISGSMIDVRGVNFQLARSVLLRTLGASPEENMGLAFFSTAAFAPIALTNCHEVFVTLMHENLYQSDIFKDFVGGTDGSAGVNVATKLLEQSDARIKRIVFIGDLEDNDRVLFARTLKQAQQNGIQEIELIGINVLTGVYQHFESYGLDVTLVASEVDAKKIGPLPRDLNKIEEASFSSQLAEEQLVIGRIVLGIVIGIIILNLYTRRPFTLRRKK